MAITVDTSFWWPDFLWMDGESLSFSWIHHCWNWYLTVLRFLSQLRCFMIIISNTHQTYIDVSEIIISNKQTLLKTIDLRNNKNNSNHSPKRWIPSRLQPLRTWWAQFFHMKHGFGLGVASLKARDVGDAADIFFLWWVIPKEKGWGEYIYIVANINIVTVRIKSIVYNYLYQHD